MTGKRKEVCLVKNKTLVVNMQHVKWKEIPPLKGPNSQGLNIPLKQVKNVSISEKINGRNRQIFTERKANVKYS